MNDKEYTKNVHPLYVTETNNAGTYFQCEKCGALIKEIKDWGEPCVLDNFYLQIEEVDLRGNSMPIPVIVEGIEFPSIKHAARVMGCSDVGLRAAIKANRKFKGLSVSFGDDPYKDIRKNNKKIKHFVDVKFCPHCGREVVKDREVEESEGE